ncbi:MAG: hypothetical protein JSW00_05645 [Thermoplasmata archaeon]|nr:MAG: hypothetical protein JSW00_05645 [Thermoplasmata archaeon]
MNIEQANKIPEEIINPPPRKPKLLDKNLIYPSLKECFRDFSIGLVLLGVVLLCMVIYLRINLSSGLEIILLLLSLFSGLYGIVLSFLGIMGFLQRFSEKRAQYRMVKSWLPAIAEINKKQYVGDIGFGSSPMKIEYTFTDRNNVKVISSYQRLDHLFSSLQVGHKIVILYNPDKPKSTAPYDNLYFRANSKDIY